MTHDPDDDEDRGTARRLFAPDGIDESDADPVEPLSLHVPKEGSIPADSMPAAEREARQATRLLFGYDA